MNERTYYTAKEVADIVGCKQNTAYKIIAKLNDQLKKEGFIVMQGKVNRIYFHQHYLMSE